MSYHTMLSSIKLCPMIFGHFGDPGLQLKVAWSQVIESRLPPLVACIEEAEATHSAEDAAFWESKHKRVHYPIFTAY